ncbi:IS1096 element passenger TnpR family protein [Novipirellula artificiosorum]|nr:plasmid pRiA4b ORF-3 family protein [Novipirellula artificiosorum]
MNDVRNLFGAEFSATHRATLQQTKIDERLPGPLLTSIDTLIAAIGTGIQTTNAYFALPQRVLAELNESMVEPMPHDLKRPQLRSFPTLMGLFMLLRGTGLAVGETKPKRAVLIDPAAVEQWQSLNPTERFFNLMGCCLYDASWDCVGVRSRGDSGLLSEIRNVYLRLHEQVTELNDDRFGIVYGVENSVALCLLHQFGWLRLDYDAQPKPGKAANVRRIERTEFGNAMFVATCQLGAHEEETTVALQAKLQPIFPAWTKTLTRSEPEFREGQHTFKVSLGKIWRRIAAPADAVLEDLADAILAAFGFDSDHLYQFELRDMTGSSINIVGPHLDDAAHFADEMRIGEVPLAIGDSMVFHYDFGDDWRFKVTLESIQEGDASAFKLTATSGQSPEQYDRDEW